MTGILLVPNAWDARYGFQIWQVLDDGKAADIQQCSNDVRLHPTSLDSARAVYSLYEIRCVDDVIVALKKTSMEVLAFVHSLSDS